MDWKNLHGYIEVSPFMLFESTGDSEEDSDLNNSSLNDDTMELTYDDVDDCQSCCSDPCEIFKACDDDQFRDQDCHDYNFNYNPNYRRQNDEDEDNDDDSAIDQECASRNVGFLSSRMQKKCKVYVDSKMEPIHKEEKDKLFWDTCLAS